MTAEKPSGAAGPTATALKAKIRMWQAEIAKLEAHVAGHQANSELPLSRLSERNSLWPSSCE